eukprot:c29194_g1_i5 orf=436-3120(+)
MGARLRDMIRAIRACKTAAEERSVVKKECAALRTAFNENDQDFRHRNLAKLMFINMLGYPTHFGQMECLKLIASPGFPEKRIGYLGLMLLLDERQEVLMLVTNSLKNDLNHSNQFIIGIALCSLGNICSAEMARDLASEVEKLLQSNNAYIRKKAALCSVRIVRKVPDIAENLLKPATGLLSDKNHGVLISGIKLCTELCRASTVALDHFRKQTAMLVRILKSMITSGYAPEYDVGGIMDPFLQIKILRLLRLLGHGDADSSDAMSDILAQVATNTESNKNAGNAILYECVQTIMDIEAIGGLRVLAINILGRFLSNKDNNIRYVALNMLMRAVAVDTQAVQRHRATILECVKDADISIRQRALELVYVLVNENNVKTLTKELLDYLKSSDSDFKADLTKKICSIVDKFSPNKLWYIDQMIKVMSEAGKYVTDEVTHALVVVISNALDLQGYTVRSLYRSFQHWDGQESLAQATVWCVGEYGEMLVNHTGELETEEPVTVTESDTVDLVERVLKDLRVSPETRAGAVTALLKLSSRFPSCTEHIKGLILQNKGNSVLELQQRSIEFGSILEKHQNLKEGLVDRMPVLDEGIYNAKRYNRTGSDVKIAPSPQQATSNLPNGSEKPVTSGLADLLDLSIDDSAPQSHTSAGDFLQDLLGIGPISSAEALPSSDVLLDLLSLGTVASTSSSSASTSVAPSNPLTQVSPPSADPLPHVGSINGPDLLSQEPGPSATSLLPVQPVNGALNAGSPSTAPASTIDLLNDFGMGVPAAGVAPAFPSIIAFQSKALKLSFDFSKSPEKPSTTLIKATFINLSSTQYTHFIFQAAVPKFMQLHLDPASSSLLPANGGGVISQSISIDNSMHGQKNLVMRLRIGYKVNGQDVLEQGQVNNFPAGL